MNLFRRIAALLHRSRLERDMDLEMRAHLERETQQNIARGLSPEEARCAARRAFGGVDQLKERERDARGWRWLEVTVRDVRHALRMFRQRPGFTAVVVLIPAVGIGAVTVMFSVLWGAVLRPLPFPEPERLVWAEALTDKGRPNSVSALDYFDYREQCPAFESLAARSVWQSGRIVSGRGEVERASSLKVSGNFFHTFGCQPQLGRPFAPGEEAAGGPAVVILSEAFWQRKFGRDRDAVGADLTVDGAVHRIIGVAPAAFDYPGGVELWLPMQRGGPEESGRGNNNFLMIGRMADGVDLDHARTQMAAVAARIAAENPGSKAGWSATLTPLHEHHFGGIRLTLVMLMGATVLLLFIACANLSSLLLTRVMSRQGEIAVRLSLGASTLNIARQLLTETLAITAIGAALGVGLAEIGIRTVKALGPTDLPRLNSVAIDARALAVAIAAALLATVLAGVAPALRGSRVDLLSHLRESGRATESRRQLLVRRLLVAGQVALSLVLLVMTGLLLRSAIRLQQVDPGFRSEGLVTVSVQVPTPGDTDAGPQVQQRFDSMLERIRALPGVTAAAGADQLPLFGGPYNGVHRADQPPQSSSDRVPATRRIVTREFFHTMGIPILSGREFDATDTTKSPTVTVVSQALARRLFGDDNPVGKVMTLPWGPGIPLQIVGVAGDVRDFGLAEDFRPAFYLPFEQHASRLAALRLVIRGDGDPVALIPPVRTVVHEVEKDAPLYAITTLNERIAHSTARSRFAAILLSSFAVIATLLAAAGLFGLMSYAVAQRTHEIGVRMALGAQRTEVLRLVIRQGVLLALAGITVGTVGALLAARLIASQLHGIGPTDAPTFATAACVLAAAALAASAIPAVRAIRINPVDALRTE